MDEVVPNAKPLPFYGKDGNVKYVCVQRTRAPMCRLLAPPAAATGPIGEALAEFTSEVNSFFALRAAHMLQRLRRDTGNADLTLVLRLSPNGLVAAALPRAPAERLEVASA